MHEHCELSAPKIAPLIPSPRSLEAGASVAVSVVYKVLAHKATYGNVFEKNRKAVDRKMIEEHARMLFCVITERPFLYLDEIAAPGLEERKERYGVLNDLNERLVVT